MVTSVIYFSLLWERVQRIRYDSWDQFCWFSAIRPESFHEIYTQTDDVRESLQSFHVFTACTVKVVAVKWEKVFTKMVFYYVD